jgi:hypothetical protein
VSSFCSERFPGLREIEAIVRVDQKRPKTCACASLATFRDGNLSYAFDSDTLARKAQESNLSFQCSPQNCANFRPWKVTRRLGLAMVADRSGGISHRLDH